MEETLSWGRRDPLNATVKQESRDLVASLDPRLIIAMPLNVIVRCLLKYNAFFNLIMFAYRVLGVFKANRGYLGSKEGR